MLPSSIDKFNLETANPMASIRHMRNAVESLADDTGALRTKDSQIDEISSALRAKDMQIQQMRKANEMLIRVTEKQIK